MSSVINHKIRSRRGYRKQRTILAPSHSPMIAMDKKQQRKAYRHPISSLFLRKTAAS